MDRSSSRATMPLRAHTATAHAATEAALGTYVADGNAATGRSTAAERGEREGAAALSAKRADSDFLSGLRTVFDSSLFPLRMAKDLRSGSERCIVKSTR